MDHTVSVLWPAVFLAALNTQWVTDEFPEAGAPYQRGKEPHTVMNSI